MASATIAFILLGLLYVPQLATISATFPALFPTPVRFAGFAIAYNVSTSIFGGTAPLLYQGALKAGRVNEFVIYITAVIAVSLVVYIFFLKNKGPNWLDGTRR